MEQGTHVAHCESEPLGNSEYGMANGDPKYIYLNNYILTVYVLTYTCKYFIKIYYVYIYIYLHTSKIEIHIYIYLCIYICIRIY